MLFPIFASSQSVENGARLTSRKTSTASWQNKKRDLLVRLRESRCLAAKRSWFAVRESIQTNIETKQPRIDA
jgi:hypothetical protein